MPNATPKATSPIGKIVCSTFGHRFIETQKITNNISEYRCTCCGDEVSESLNGNLQPLTPKIKDINSCLSSFFEKKTRRVYSEVS
ncbi:MAG: hypothetical protein CVU03_05255 [Bacteroidetes bacterium HGW-Bacteroidetes-2]|nr:MAG: hypothetical protein CVU03_05255 [Bacteroidetes bacterium HGW-Bacteroidetes-2]